MDDQQAISRDAANVCRANLERILLRRPFYKKASGSQDQFSPPTRSPFATHKRTAQGSGTLPTQVSSRALGLCKQGFHPNQEHRRFQGPSKRMLRSGCNATHAPGCLFDVRRGRTPDSRTTGLLGLGLSGPGSVCVSRLDTESALCCVQGKAARNNFNNPPLHFTGIGAEAFPNNSQVAASKPTADLNGFRTASYSTSPAHIPTSVFSSQRFFPS